MNKASLDLTTNPTYNPPLEPADQVNHQATTFLRSQPPTTHN